MAGDDNENWRWSLTVGNLVGLLAFVTIYPPAARALSVAFLGATWSGPVTSFGTGVTYVSLLLLPAITSGRARRHYFWWALAPSLFLFLWLVGENTLDQGARGGAQSAFDALWMLAIILSGWLLGAGPVSVIRWSLRRRVAARLQAEAALGTARQAASRPQEGVWPPPPNYGP